MAISEWDHYRHQIEEKLRSLDEEDPFRRLIQKLLQSYEGFVELSQQYQACCEEVEHMPFRTQAERQKLR